MNASTLMLVAGTLGLAACGDNGTSDPADARPPGIDAADPIDAAPDVDAAPYVAPAPVAVPLSAGGPDQLYAAAAGPGGTTYVVGFAAAGVTPADLRLVTVARLTAAGDLDATFGGDGIVPTAIEFRGGNGEISMVTQADGKLVIAATVASLAAPADRDVVVFRLDADGELDPLFADAGIRRLDLNTAHDPGGGMPLTAFDSARGLALDASERIYVHAAQRGEVPADRTDTDFAVVRLTADGDVDGGFATAGKHLLDITGGTPAASLSATPRAVVVLADGSVLGTGYTTNPSFGAGPQPVLYKLDPDGVLVPGFADGGLFHDIVLTTQTEIYSVAVHGNQLVTAGYGREAGDQNDWVSLRFSTEDGARDLTWGGAANGAVVLGTPAGDNCRNAIGLPAGKTILLGSIGPSNMLPMQDAAFAVLSATGTLDPAYGAAPHTYAFPGTPGNDALWGGTVSGDAAVMVGYKSAGATQTADVNDDSFVVILPIE